MENWFTFHEVTALSLLSPFFMGHGANIAAELPTHQGTEQDEYSSTKPRVPSVR